MPVNATCRNYLVEWDLNDPFAPAPPGGVSASIMLHHNLHHNLHRARVAARDSAGRVFGRVLLLVVVVFFGCVILLHLFGGWQITLQALTAMLLSLMT